jgi:predicted AAA+ superfamily ATPase
MDRAEVLAVLNRMNTWWNGEPVPESIYEDHRRRDFYTLFTKVRDDREIVTIRGPRQVGKTTIVGQLIDELLPEDVSRHEKERVFVPHDPETILYLNIDNSQILSDPEGIIDESLQAYQDSVLGKSFRNLDDDVYVFIDEIQKCPNWEGKLKYYTDTYSNLNFIVTGSVSTLIDSDADETLTGRLDKYTMYPMKFVEYLRYEDVLDDEVERSTELREALKSSLKDGDPDEFVDKLSSAYGLMERVGPEMRSLKDDYLTKGGYPDVLDEDYTGAYNILDSNLKSTLRGDIPATFGVEKEQSLFNLLNMCAASSGQKMNIQNMADTAGIDRDTAERYLDYLKEFFLIETSSKYYRSEYETGGRKKVYIQDVGHLNTLQGTLSGNAIHDSERKGRMLETACSDHLRRLQFYLSNYQDATVPYWDAQGEIDFILSGTAYTLPVEVKSGDPTDRSLRGISNFLRDDSYDAEFGMVVNDANVLDTDGDLVYVPSWLFLFVC